MLKIIIGVLVVAIIAVGGFMYYQSVQEKLANPPENTKVAISDEVTTPTPTKAEKVDPGEYTIEVQNGGGVAGQAGAVQGILEAEDYVVEGTANADNYDYKKTVIQAKEEVSKVWLDNLKKLLGKNYEVQARVEKLDKGADTDVVVIVGSLDADGKALGESEDSGADDTTPTPTEETSPTPTPKS